jgi:hypothetical protein
MVNSSFAFFLTTEISLIISTVIITVAKFRYHYSVFTELLLNSVSAAYISVEWRLFIFHKTNTGITPGHSALIVYLG